MFGLSLCRHVQINDHLGRIWGLNSYNAFGSSYVLGQRTGLEGPWVAPIYTALFLFSLSFYILVSRASPRPTFLKYILSYYAFATAMVEVCRVIFDANRFAFVWAALHNLGEWGILVHLLFGRQQVPKAWPFAMLWILVILNLVLFLPDFTMAALSEQITGIWCDWLMVTLMALRIAENRNHPQVKTVFKFGLAAACMHMAEILPLVALLTGYIKCPSLATSFVISLSSPITFYLYSQFSLHWDALAGGPEAHALGDANGPDEEPLLPAGSSEKSPESLKPRTRRAKAAAAANDDPAGDPAGDATSPYLAATRSPAHFALILVGTFIMGLGTVVVPRFAFPECHPRY